MKALSLAHIAPNETCARRIDPLGGRRRASASGTRILERRRDMARTIPC